MWAAPGSAVTSSYQESSSSALGRDVPAHFPLSSLLFVPSNLGLCSADHVGLPLEVTQDSPPAVAESQANMVWVIVYLPVLASPHVEV